MNALSLNEIAEEKPGNDKYQEDQSIKVSVYEEELFSEHDDETSPSVSD
jgi:hypothetical protein